MFGKPGGYLLQAVYTAALLLLYSPAFGDPYTEPAIRDTTRNTSFFLRSLSSRYHYLENDFEDAPRKPDRLDFLREDAERLRMHCRPSGPGFAVLNLQWKDQRFFLNDFRLCAGPVKTKKQPFSKERGKGGVFSCIVLSGECRLSEEMFFDVPRDFHFDSVVAEAEDIHGGTVQRPAVDFVIKVPLYNNAADRILLFKKNTQGPAYKEQRSLTDLNAQPRFETVTAGEVLF